MGFVVSCHIFWFGTWKVLSFNRFFIGSISCCFFPLSALRGIYLFNRFIPVSGIYFKGLLCISVDSLIFCVENVFCHWLAPVKRVHLSRFHCATWCIFYKRGNIGN